MSEIRIRSADVDETFTCTLRGNRTTYETELCHFACTTGTAVRIIRVCALPSISTRVCWRPSSTSWADSAVTVLTHETTSPVVFVPMISLGPVGLALQNEPPTSPVN